ncbi:MAG: PLP-dependent aminotransferase family protein [Pseudomonadota bacterium]
MAKRPTFAAWLDDTNDVIKVFLAAGQIPDLINLAGGLPAPEVWPVAPLADIASDAVQTHSNAVLNYSPVDGLPDLRDAIAARFTKGALQLTRENVLIVSAGTQGLDLLGKVLLEEGATIACQSPAYLGALDAWRPRRPDYRPMRLEANDLDLGAAFTGAQFAYVVPNFSNPSGRLVEMDQRRALLAAAQDTGTWLVEDDPYAGLFFEGAPLPTLLALSAQGDATYQGPVIYLGTVSKELAPGLRVGWVIAAPEVIKAMTAAKQGSDMFTCGLAQQTVLGAMRQGLSESGVAKAVDLYRARRDALVAAMDQHLSPYFDWDVPKGGMFVWATAKDPDFDTDQLMQVGLGHKVCISPGSVFDPLGKDRRSVRINFTFNSEDRLQEGVKRLAAASRDLIKDAGKLNQIA